MSVREENVRLRIEAVSELPEVAQQLSELIRLEKELVAQMQQSRTQAAGQSQAQVTAINSVTDALKKQQQEEKRTNDEGSNSRKKATGEFAELGNSVRNFTTLLAAAFTINEIKNFGMDVIDAKTKIDSLKISLDVMLGSKRESAELYQQMITLAKQTPFTLEEVAENVVKLKAYNIATAELIPTITALGNIAAAVGKEKLPQLTLAYGQVQNFGRLMGTELRQFTEAGVPLFDLLATSMGKARSEVIKLTEDHKIMAVDVKRAIMEASEVGGKYFNLMSLQAKTVGGEVSNLGDTFFVAKGRIGDFFEKEIKGGIRTLADLTTATVGSNSAIGRTLDVIKSAAAAFVTYQVATNGARVASTALAVAQVAKNAALAAGNLVIGTYNLIMISSAGATDAFTSAQVRSAAAARSTWAAFAANPLGPILITIGLLTTAYYAFKAANEDVTASMGEQEYQIRKEQDELSRLAETALTAAQGSKQRKQAIDELISKYPEYFAGLDSEKTNNNQLNSILGKVNGSYKDRIALAKEAYQTEKLGEQQRKIWDEEEAAIGRLTKRLPELKQFGNDAGAVLKYLNENADANFKARNANSLGSWFDAAVNGNPVKTLESLQKNQAEVEKQFDASATRIKTAKAGDQASEVAVIQAHYAVLRTQADGNSKELARLNAAEKLAISKANDTFHEAESVAIGKAQKKKVDQAKLSAAELSALLKADNDQTLADKLKLLDAQEKVEIESANKSAKNKQDATARILAIDAQYNQQRAVLLEQDRENFSRSVDVDIAAIERRNAGETAFTTIRIQSFKEVAKAARDSEKEIQELSKETAAINKETADVQIKSRREIINLGLDLLSQQSGLIGQLSQGIKGIYANLDGLSSKATEAAQKGVDDAKINLTLIKSLYEENGQRTQLDIANASQQVAQSENKLAQVKSDSAAAALGIFSTIYQIASAIAAAFNQMQAETYQAIADGLGKAREAYTNLYDFIQQAAADAYRAEMEAFTGSLDQRIVKINEYYAAEKVLMQDRAGVDAQLAFSQELAESSAKTSTKVKDHIQDIVNAQKNYFVNLEQQVIAQAELELKRAGEVRDAKIQFIDDALKKFTETIDAEIAAEQRGLDARKAANEQYYSDKQLRLQEDDVYRAQLLAQGEAREVAALEAAKQRELTRAAESGATQEELARITVAFDKLIADKHEEYQTAVGNKSKETSLANAEAKAQEKDTVNGLENSSAATITALQNQIKQQEIQAAADKKRANEDYANAVMSANKEIFEANRRMKVAELEAEIAILRSKRNIFNQGKIDAAIGDLNQAIGTINGISFNTGSVNLGGAISGAASTLFAALGISNKPVRADNGGDPGAVFDKKGNPMTLTYNSSGKKITVYGSDGQPFEVAYADGFVPATGERLFKGTPYLQGLGYPNGIDTVPTMLTKGERVLSVDHNAALSGITNEDVVNRVSFYDKFAAQFPQLLDPARWSEIAQTTMRLPAGIMNSDGGNSIDLSQMVGEMQGFRKDLKAFKPVSIVNDRNGSAVYTKGVQSKIQHMDAIFKG